MDFHTLSRKELQALCKKNKIPANITNVAMADALAALPQVEGLDDILNPKEGDAGTPDIRPRTASRISTQRKARNEPDSVKVYSRIRRGATAGSGEGVVEQENKDNNVPATPAAMLPSSRRRAAPAPSTRRTKKEAEIQEEDGEKGKPKTAVAAPRSRARATGRSACTKSEASGGASVQQAYSTRRSVRLVGKSLSKMSLLDTEDEAKIDDVSEELSAVSEHVEEESSVSEKGASLKTVSSVVTENSDDLEVSSLNNTGYECQSQEVVSEKVNDVEAELQAENQEEVSENVNDVEAELQVEKQEDVSENVNDMEAELLAEKQEEVSENVNDMEAELLAEKQEELSENVNDMEAELQAEKQEEVSENVNDLEAELQAEKQEEVSENVNDMEAVLQAEKQEEVSENVNDLEAELQAEKQEEVSENVNDMDSDFKVEGSFETYEDSTEAGSEFEDSCDSSALDDDALSVEVSKEAVIDVPGQDIAALSVVAPAGSCVDSVAGLFPMTSVDDASESNTDNEGSNEDDTCIPEFEPTCEIGGQAADAKEVDDAVEAVTEVCNESFVDEKASIEEPSEESNLAEIKFDVTGAPSAIAAEKAEAVIEVEDVTLQFSSLDVSKDVSNEIQMFDMPNANMMKENELQNMSMRGLKKILKQKFAGPQELGKSNSMVQEVEKKRTALQALPQNVK